MEQPPTLNLYQIPKSSPTYLFVQCILGEVKG